MNEYLKEYIELQKQFRETKGNPDSVRALYDPYGYAKPDINTQPLFYSLRDNEIYLDIGNEGKINNTFEIVCQWMDKLLIPKMNELCATE